MMILARCRSNDKTVAASGKHNNEGKRKKEGVCAVLHYKICMWSTATYLS